MTVVVCSWSGGKDAALALDELQRDPAVTVVGCLATVSTAHDRVVMHGVRRSLLSRQVAAMGLDLQVVELPPDPSNDVYEARMERALSRAADRGVEAVAFGDLALEDVRAYREARLADGPLAGRWPVWGRDTASVAESILDRGFRATVACVDDAALGPAFAGRPYDRSLLADLPADVDPCGENGEFHTFVTDGPVFEAPVPVATGERVTRSVGDATFHYVDLRPVQGG